MGKVADELAKILAKIERLQAATLLPDPTPSRVSIEFEGSGPPSKQYRRFVGTRSLRIGGCIGVRAYNFLYLPYSVGDIVFVKSKAQKGILERVAIFRYIVSDSDVRCRAYSKYQVMYVDTMRCRWYDDDLVSHADAVDLALDYLTNRADQLRELRDCS